MSAGSFAYSVVFIVFPSFLSNCARVLGFCCLPACLPACLSVCLSDWLAVLKGEKVGDFLNKCVEDCVSLASLALLCVVASLLRSPVAEVSGAFCGVFLAVSHLRQLLLLVSQQLLLPVALWVQWLSSGSRGVLWFLSSLHAFPLSGGERSSVRFAPSAPVTRSA